MNKIKRVIKRFIAGILSVITCISVFIISPGSSLVAHADEPTSAGYSAEGAKATAGAMMQNFANGGETELKISDITESEFRAWGVLLSNFFVPFHTDIYNLKTESVTMKQNGEDKQYSAWKTFKTVWKENSGDGDTELLSDLLNKYKNVISSEDGAKPLYIGGTWLNTQGDNVDVNLKITEDSEHKAKLGHLFTLSSIYYGGWYLYWLDKGVEDKFENRHIVFSVPQDEDAGYAARALLACIRAIDVDGTSVESGNGSTEKYVRNNIDSRLYITAFGDIVCNYNSSDTFDTVTCIIPACMNPFTFNNICEGCKKEDDVISGKNLNISFYINNIFGLSNFLQNQDINNKSVGLFKANSSGGLGSGNLVLDDSAFKNHAITSNTGKVYNNLSCYAHVGKMLTLSSVKNNDGHFIYVPEFYILNESEYNKYNKFADWLNKKFDKWKNNYYALGGLTNGTNGVVPQDAYDFLYSVFRGMYSVKKYGGVFLIWPRESTGSSMYYNDPNYGVGKHKPVLIGYDSTYYKSTEQPLSSCKLCFDAQNSGFEENVKFYIFRNSDNDKTDEEDKKYLELLDKASSGEKIGGTKVTQAYWSVKAQSLISDNAEKMNYKIGSNTMAIIGRSSEFDIIDKDKYTFNNKIVTQSKFFKNISVILGNDVIINDTISKDYFNNGLNGNNNGLNGNNKWDSPTATSMFRPGDYDTEYYNLVYNKLERGEEDREIKGDLFREITFSKSSNNCLNMLNKYNGDGEEPYLEYGDLGVTAEGDGSSNIYYVTNKKLEDLDKNESRFLSIYLGSLYKDPNIIESARNYTDENTESIYLLWWCLYDGKKAENNKYDYKAINSLVNFQIPLDKVYSKLGVFKTGIKMSVASDGTDSSYAKDFGIYTINYASDLDEEKTVMNKIHNGIKDGNDGKILPESLYTLSAVNIRNDKSWTLQGHNEDKDFAAWYYSFDRNLFANIYWAYIEDIVGIKASDLSESLSNGTEVKRTLKSFEHLPKIDDSNAFKSENIFGLLSEDDKEEREEIANAELEAKQASIVDWVYKILSVGDTINNIGDIVAEKATAAGQYVIGWLKGMIDSLFIGWNNYMLGVDVSAGVTGSVSNIGNSTKSKTYSTAMGYMTTPTFSNLPITSWIMSNFQLIYVIIMVLVVVILIMMVLTRARRLPQAILIFVCMAFIIVLPANMLNGAIGISNNFTESVYADKFQYWAISQHAEYLKGVSYSQNQTSADLYDNLNRQDESSAGGVTLKWMAPKKWGIAEQIKAAAKNTDGLKLFLRFAGDRIDAEDFSDYTPGDTYLYRPYYGIYVEAYNLWSAIRGQDKTANIKLTDLGKSINNLWFGGSSSKEYKVSADMKTGNSIADAQNVKNGVVRNSNFFRYVSTRGDSIMRSAVGGTGFGNSKDGIMTYQAPYFDSYYKDSQVIKDIQPEYISQGRIYAMYSDINLVSALFNFNINNTLFSDSNNPCGLWLYKAGKDSSNTVNSDGTSSNSYTTGIKAYFDYSESPYYYFYNALADLKVKTDNGSYVYGNTDFVDLILKNETFKVTNQQSKAYGELKDYLDLEGLFSYVIPLLNQGNQNAQQYFSKYGQTVDRNDSIFSDNTITERYSKTESSTTESSSNSKSVELKDNLEVNPGDSVVLKFKSDEKNKYSVCYKKSTASQWRVYKKDAEKIEGSVQLKEEGIFNFKVETKKSNGTVQIKNYRVTVNDTSSSQSNNNSTSNNSSTVGFKEYRTAGEDLYNKYDQQLQAIWNMYSPWVAQMIAANNKSEKVRSGFGYVELLEPWNPADYRYFGRDMAFSPADARVHGYQSYDLSNVETKMHKVLEDTYYDILDLVNYKDYTMVSSEYGSHVLISAAAMCATFNFNREFSDNGFMSTDITLYPQSYELKNMNFDAYLRIILGNSMGMNPVTMKNSDYSGSLTIYEEFIHNTSVWSGLVLVAEDFLAVFIVPLLKIMLIVVIFVLALALAISCIINKPDKMIKVFLSTFIAPLFGMTAIFIAHSLVISWFIGDGLGSKVIDTHSISVTTGDPTLTLLLMIVVDLVTSILMWKLLKFAAKSTAKYIQDIGSGIAALGKGTFSGLAQVITAAAGVGTLALGAASTVGGAAKATVDGAVGVGKAINHKKEVHQERKLDKERNKLLREGNKSGTGTGKSKTGTGGSGTGAGTSKPTGATGVGNKHTESMASDIRAIRQKLEKGFNPAGMTPTGSTSTGTGTADKKKINSKGNNVTPGSTAMKRQEEFNKRRAGVVAEKLRGGSAEDRMKYVLQTRAMTDRFEKLKNDNNAVFDKKSGKWSSDGSATTTTKINRLYTDINKRKSVMYQATSPVEPASPVRSSSVNVGTHGVRTGKHARGSKRKKSKKNRKAKR